MATRILRNSEGKEIVGWWHGIHRSGGINSCKITFGWEDVSMRQGDRRPPICPCCTSFDDPVGTALHDVEIYGFVATKETYGDDGHPRIYGDPYPVIRDSYAVDLRTAEAFVKLIRSAEKRVAAMYKERGSTRGWEDAAGRWLAALGIRSVWMYGHVTGWYPQDIGAWMHRAAAEAEALYEKDEDRLSRWAVPA